MKLFLKKKEEILEDFTAHSIALSE